MDVFLHNQRLKSQLGSIHFFVCVFFINSCPLIIKAADCCSGLDWTAQSFWMALHYRAVIDGKQCSAVKERGALDLITPIILSS